MRPLHLARTWEVLDIVTAVALSATSVAAVASGDVSFGSRPIAYLLATACGLPIALRRRWPVAVAVVVLATTAACAWAAAPHQSALQPFVALTLAFYSVGSLSRQRRGTVAVVALGLAAAPLMLAAVLVRHTSPGDVVPSWLWLFAAWGVGRFVSSARSRSQQLAAANQMLLAQQDLQTQAAIAVERGRISRELHDIIAHNVSMMVVQAGAAQRVLGDREPLVAAALETIAGTGREAVDEMRRMLGMLRTFDDGEALGRQPSLADLDTLVEGFRRAGLRIDLTTTGQTFTLAPGLDLTAYRIVQEGLTNALKHGGACRVAVALRYAVDGLQICVEDDGGAGRPALMGTGLGLVGMRERAALYGGTVEAGSRVKGGYAVSAMLPLVEGVGR
jgi:signal transduction histidine kinase